MRRPRLASGAGTAHEAWTAGRRGSGSGGVRVRYDAPFGQATRFSASGGNAPATGGRRSYLLPRAPADQAASWFRRRFGAGCVRDGEGRVTGAWWMLPCQHGTADAPRYVATVLCRTPTGVVAVQVANPPNASLAGWARDMSSDGRLPSAATRIPFGQAVWRLAEVVAGRPPAGVVTIGEAMGRALNMRGPGAEAEAAHNAWMADQLRPFLDTLDPEAIALAETEQGRSYDEEWAGIDGTFVPGAPLRRALVALPEFHEALVTQWRVDRAGLLADVVRNDPLAVVRREMRRHSLPRVSADLATALAAHRSLVDDGTSPVRVDHLGYGDPLRHVLGPLNRLPAESVPRDLRNWRAYLLNGDVMLRALSLGHAAWIGIMIGTVDDWDRWSDDLRRAAGCRGDDDLAAKVPDVRDGATAFVRELVIPAALLADRDQSTCALSMLRVLQGGRRLARVLASSRRWHADRPALNDVIADLPGSGPRPPPWGRILPDLDVDGLRVVHLHDEAALAAEGRNGPDRDGAGGLAHCVAGYAQACRAGAARVASIRRPLPDGSWERLSTVEFRSGPDGVTVAQHRGRGNRFPPPEAVDALAAYLDLVDSGEIEFDPAGLVPVPAPPRAEVGYAPLVPGNWERVRDAWAPHLPRVLRGLAPDAFLDAVARSQALPLEMWATIPPDTKR